MMGEQSVWLEQLRAITSIANDAIVVVDEARHIVLCNHRAESLFSWPGSQLVGESLDVLFAARSREVVREHLRRLADEPRRSREQTLELEAARRSGETFSAEVSFASIELGDKRLFPMVVKDGSELRRAEEALRLSDERLHVALRSSPGVVWNQDRELRYSWIVNPKAPFEVDHVIGQSDFDLFPRHEADQLAEMKRAVMQSGEGARRIVRTTVGSETYDYDVTCEPLRDAAGQVAGITCAAWDVTAQRRAEREHRILADLGATLMSASPDYEATLRQLARLAVRELGDWFLVDIVEDSQVRRLQAMCADPAKAGLADKLETQELDRDRPHLMFATLQTHEPVLVSEVSPAYLESISQSPAHLELLEALEIRSLVVMPLLVREKLLGVFALISSTDERRYQERDLRFLFELARIAALAVDTAQLYRSAQRAIAARDEVLGVVAHDLRDPLNAILMQSQLVQRFGGGSEPRERRAIELIRRAALRMDRLIRDMLDIARLDSGALAVESTLLSPGAILAEVADARRPEAAEKEISIVLDVAAAVPEILADRDRLLQVFDNLLGNAVKFTPPGGTMTLGAAPSAEGVVFRVVDTGRGIDPGHLPHLFDRYWRGSRDDRRGAGLGMFIVKGIVDAHGGDVWVESEPGRGTAVYFSLPLATAIG